MYKWSLTESAAMLYRHCNDAVDCADKCVQHAMPMLYNVQGILNTCVRQTVSVK